MLRIHVLGELVVETSTGPVELDRLVACALAARLARTEPRQPSARRAGGAVLARRARHERPREPAQRPVGPAASARRRDRRSPRRHARAGRPEGPPAVWIDAAAFEEHFAAGRLDEALALCRGELLAGLDDEWVYEHRDAHRLRVSELLEAMAAKAEPGDPALAVSLTRKRAALDPLAEDAQRALIERLGRAGDRSGALLAYSRFRERLRTELGISASAKTRAVVAQIREGPAPVEPMEDPAPPDAEPQSDVAGGKWAPGAPFPLPRRLRQRAGTAFVGRERELVELRRLWSEVGDGAGARLALVVGEAGIGKTRLIHELAHEAHAGGAIVLHGSANEDLLMPHQHFVEALEHLLAVAAPGELARRVEPRAADLGPIAPSLADDSARQAGDERPQESRRYRLFEAVAGLLEELGADAPVLLVFDDLHWADQATVALLRHVLESRPDTRLLVLATQRPREGAPDAQAEALQRLSQGQFVERVALEGLDEADIDRLSHELSGRRLAPELTRAIREETAGNPFFVQEIVRHLSDSDRTASVLSLAQAEVPERVREVVDLRLARLSEACVRLLTVAAVIGLEFQLGPLEQVSDLEGEDLAAVLDEALDADVLQETEAGEHESFAFSTRSSGGRSSRTSPGPTGGASTPGSPRL